LENYTVEIAHYYFLWQRGYFMMTPNWFDPVFWTVTINGKPSTEKALLAIEDKRWAFKIDTDALVIRIKSEP